MWRKSYEKAIEREEKRVQYESGAYCISYNKTSLTTTTCVEVRKWCQKMNFNSDWMKSKISIVSHVFEIDAPSPKAISTLLVPTTSDHDEETTVFSNFCSFIDTSSLLFIVVCVFCRRIDSFFIPTYRTYKRYHYFYALSVS